MLDPHGFLAHVHPDLVKVMETASQDQPFEIIQGLRTLTQEEANVARGASQTLHSRHLADARYGGVAMAVDVAAIQAGHITWDSSLYYLIAKNVKAAAAKLGIPLDWGGDWKTLKDLGHFQLPWMQYP